MRETAVETAAAASSEAVSESEAWRKLSSMALEALARGAVEFSGEEREAFAGRLRDSLAALEGPAETSQILIAAGSLAQAIEHYQGQTQRHFNRLVDQFRDLTLVLLDHASLPSELKQNIAGTLALTELPALEAELRLTLETARTAAPSAALAPFGASHANAALTDSCTGLPTRLDAEAVIQRVISSGAPAYVAAFYVHRMQLINGRFGDAIGNQVLLFCSQHIATNLSGPNDSLFRWRGPGFVAVIERNESPLAIASEVQRFSSMPLSRFFETPSRTVYLPIKVTAEIFPTAGKTLEEVIDQVQTSMNAHSPTD